MRGTMMNCSSVVRAFFVWLFLATTPSHGFSSSKQKVASLTDEAVAVFAKQYPFLLGSKERQQSGMVSRFKPRKLGMPNQDIFTGTVYKKKSSDQPEKLLFSIDEPQARAAFTQMAKLYGPEEALQMVKILPVCLSFDYKAFDATLKEFSDIFGEENAKAMVGRNPGLLAVRPAEAASTTQQTMIFSYFLAITRPVSKLFTALLVLALLVPVVEGLTGIDIHTTFLASLSGSG